MGWVLVGTPEPPNFCGTPPPPTFPLCVGGVLVATPPLVWCGWVLGGTLPSPPHLCGWGCMGASFFRARMAFGWARGNQTDTLLICGLRFLAQDTRNGFVLERCSFGGAFPIGPRVEKHAGALKRQTQLCIPTVSGQCLQNLAVRHPVPERLCF